MQLRLEEIQEQLDHLILATPTGAKRDALCDANILLLVALSFTIKPAPQNKADLENDNA